MEVTIYKDNSFDALRHSIDLLFTCKRLEIRARTNSQLSSTKFSHLCNSLISSRELN